MHISGPGESAHPGDSGVAESAFPQAPAQEAQGAASGGRDRSPSVISEGGRRWYDPEHYPWATIIVQELVAAGSVVVSLNDLHRLACALGLSGVNTADVSGPISLNEARDRILRALIEDTPPHRHAWGWPPVHQRPARRAL